MYRNTRTKTGTQIDPALAVATSAYYNNGTMWNLVKYYEFS